MERHRDGAVVMEDGQTLEVLDGQGAFMRQIHPHLGYQTSEYLWEKLFLLLTS